MVGASSGLGLAYANHLESQDVLVTKVGRTRANSSTHVINLESPTETSAIISEVIKEVGGFDSIVFCQRYRDGQSDPYAEYQVNALSISSILELCPELFKADGLKSAVVVSSLAANFPDVKTSLSYQASKGALNSVARYYALKLAPFGIRVNTLSPFFFISERNYNFYTSNEKWQNFIQNQIPLASTCSIEQLIPKIDFLCSTDSSFITGQNFVVDGGASLKVYP